MPKTKGANISSSFIWNSLIGQAETEYAESTTTPKFAEQYHIFLKLIIDSWNKPICRFLRVDILFVAENKSV